MKKNIINFTCFVLGLVVFLTAGFFAVTYAVPDQFAESYQRALIRQYDYYKTLGPNKVVFIGNSSMAFGFDLDLMEQKIGRPCAVLGNHAGLGIIYPLNMSKENLQKGDIVVIEYDKTLDNADFGAELFLTAVGNRPELYRFVSPRHYDDVVQDYGTYFMKKLNYATTGGYHPEGAYSLSAFDERGNMTLVREESTLPEVLTDKDAKALGGWLCFPTDRESMRFTRVLNQYVDYCKSKGVLVYFTQGCYFDQAIASTDEEIAESDAVLASLLDAPLISSTFDYIYPREYMYDVNRHCNTAGVRKRTEQLYEDLCQYVDFSDGV